MAEKIFKYSTLSFILIIFWTLYLFFDYFTEKQGMFDSWGLLFNFFNSLLFAFGLACILLIIRLIFYIKKKQNVLKSNFLYILSGIFNLNLSIIWLICIILKVIDIGNAFLATFSISLFLIACFIITDIYKSNFSNKKE
jgi:hypothetical protein